MEAGNAGIGGNDGQGQAAASEYLDVVSEPVLVEASDAGIGSRGGRGTECLGVGDEQGVTF